MSKRRTLLTQGRDFADLPKAERIAQLRANVPAELRERDQWVAWKLEGENKVPYQAGSSSKASSTDPTTWSPFDEAVAAYEGHDGVAGVMFAISADDPFVCVDLDDCIAPDGVVAAEKQAIIDQLDSFTEISPSGTGVHIWVRGEIPGVRRRAPGIEMYEDDRFMAVTGNVLRNGLIADRTEHLAALYEQTFGVPEPDRITQEWLPSPL